MKKRKAQHISASPSVITRKKRPTKKTSGISPPPERPPHGWMVAGFDVSMSSMAGAAFGYDRTLNCFRGPAFACRRWNKGDHYFDRLEMAARSHDLVLDLISELGMVLTCDEVWIAQEEPFPPHGKFIAQGNSSFLKQQAEISGAFLGGLLRYGFKQIFQIHNMSWKKTVADGLTEAGFGDISTHTSKWNSSDLALEFHCRPKDSGKFRAQQWAREVFGPWAFEQTQKDVPEWPGIIERTKEGKMPRPEGSHALAVQSDDRYEALAMMEWLRLEIWSDLENMMRKSPG